MVGIACTTTAAVAVAATEFQFRICPPNTPRYTPRFLCSSLLPKCPTKEVLYYCPPNPINTPAKRDLQADI
eukprot:scaffold8930_cov46-Cylindrotheca_fusiformis.AAC.2